MNGDNYLKSLEGISCKDWNQLKTGMDRYFDNQKRELEDKIKLADSEPVARLIQSQFGQI